MMMMMMMMKTGQMRVLYRELMSISELDDGKMYEAHIDVASSET
jgi:hypothetical protein